MRRQYHLRKSLDGLLAWDIDKLVELTKDLPVKNISLSEIKEIDEAYWFNSAPTRRQILEHIRLINEVKEEYPIILDWNGRLMDGMHRIMKALLKGKEQIKAVQLEKEIVPDFIGIGEKDLPYQQICLKRSDEKTGY